LWRERHGEWVRRARTDGFEGFMREAQ
jgi:hypothetical protein